MIGPGIAIAATGVGAGDMVAAAAAGAKYGYALVWAALVGAVLKFVLNEGLARWQLATGTTLLEGWVQRLGKWVQIYFLAYLVLWSFVIGGALASACGLAAHAIAPGLPLEAWGVIHAVVAAVVVAFGRYDQFERLMKVFIGLMFLALIGCALCVSPPLTSAARSVTSASIPAGSTKFVLAVIGGVGGTLTLLAYGYWMRERGWEGTTWRGLIRTDLAVAYGLTGVFGVAVMVLAAATLHAHGVEIKGKEGVVEMAGMLGDVVGPVGHWTFLVGFWGAVATSMLGVWQGVPYMFCDFVGLVKELPDEERRKLVSPRSRAYRGYLVWLAIVPLCLLFVGKPVGLVVAYSVVGALFMPFLAATLLYMNSKREWVGEELRSGWVTNGLLVLALVLFGYLCIGQLTKVPALLAPHLSRLIDLLGL